MRGVLRFFRGAVIYIKQGGIILLRNSNVSKQFSQSIFVSLAISLTLLFFAQINLYYFNVLELPYHLRDVLAFSITRFLIAFILLTAFLTLLKPSIHTKAVSVVLILGFLFWLQGNVLVWDYQTSFNGKAIDWAHFKLYGVIDIIVWLLLIVLALLKSSFFYKHARLLSCGLIAVQVLFLPLLVFQSPKLLDWKNYQINSSQKFEFSKKKNIIILVLDSFQSDFFQEIINENKRYKNIFDGFIYFRNSTGGFPG